MRAVIAGGVSLLAAAVLFAAPSAVSATPKSTPPPPVYVHVALSATGPSPRTVTLTTSAWNTLVFVNNDSVAHTVAFRSCVFTVAAGSSYMLQGAEGHYCRSLDGVGRHPYTMDGTYPGTLRVVGLSRSVSLTPPTRSIALGHRLKLDGRLTFDNDGKAFCAQRMLIRILARHTRGQPFKRIAMFPAGPLTRIRAGKNGCTYRFQVMVRPGITTSYIARASAELWGWKQATSRPLTISIRG